MKLPVSVNIVAVFALLALGAQPLRAESNLPSEARTRIETLIRERMSRDKVPSLSVAVALDNQLAWSAAYGLADVENDVPATTRTLYRTASIDKWLTATAAMRLVEEGKLDLDAAPQRYCKAYPQKQWPMKVRQLLNHTAGVRHYWDNEEHPEKAAEEARGFFIRHTDRITPVERFKDDPLLYEPGTKYSYTSHGYRLLGCVLEGASGEAYAPLMQRVVFGPARMMHTTPDDSWAIIPHRASLYSLTEGDPVLEDGSLRRANFRDVSENLPAGGHLSTPEELVRFAVAFNTGRLIGAESMQRMSVREAVIVAPEDESYYGYGVEVTVVPEKPGVPKWQGLEGQTVLSHSGGQDGTSTRLMLLPSRGIAVAIMINRNDVGTAEITRSILGILAGVP